MRREILFLWLRVLFKSDHLSLFMVSLPVLMVFNFLSLRNSYVTAVSLLLLLIGCLSIQVVTLHQRHRTEEFLYLSLLPTWRIVWWQILLSLLLASPVLLSMQVFLMDRFPDASFVALFFIGLSAGVFAIMLGVLMGHAVRNRGVAIAMLLAFFIACGVVYWSVHEQFRYISPALNLLNPFELNYRNLIGIWASSLLMFSLAVWSVRRRGGHRRDWRTWTSGVLAICCLLGLWQYESWRDRQVDMSAYQTMRVGQIEVTYKGLTETAARKFAALMETIRKEAMQMGYTVKTYRLQIVRRFDTPAWNTTERPIKISGDTLQLDLFSNKHLDFNYGVNWAQEFITLMIAPDPASASDQEAYEKMVKSLEERVIRANPEQIYVPARMKGAFAQTILVRFS